MYVWLVFVIAVAKQKLLTDDVCGTWTDWVLEDQGMEVPLFVFHI